MPSIVKLHKRIVKPIEKNFSYLTHGSPEGYADKKVKMNGEYTLKTSIKKEETFF